MSEQPDLMKALRDSLDRDWVTVYRCQGCGKERRVVGRRRLNAYGSYCSNHDPDGSGELYVAIRHEPATALPSHRPQLEDR